MKIKHHKPLIYPIVKFFFPAAHWDIVIITWGDTAYCKTELNASLVEHERVHTEQQSRNKLIGLWWWVRYIYSPAFRLSQEIPAHIAEYRTAIRGVSSQRRAYFLDFISERLSGPLYGNVMTRDAAKRLLLGYPQD